MTADNIKNGWKFSGQSEFQNKESARNYIWARIIGTERELDKIKTEMSHCGKHGESRLSLDKLEIMYEATENRLGMYNYIFKLIELDEN